MREQVTSLGTEVAEISVGWTHTCARKTDGTLWCWGLATSGQVGNGTLGDGGIDSGATSAMKCLYTFCEPLPVEVKLQGW
jgi:alpha-tubulin suppressor-like RCC1 family protein